MRRAVLVLLLLQAVAMVMLCYYPACWQYHLQQAQTLLPADAAGARVQLELALACADHFVPDGRRALTLEYLAGVTSGDEARKYAQQAVALYEKSDGPQSEAVRRVKTLLGP